MRMQSTAGEAGGRAGELVRPSPTTFADDSPRTVRAVPRPRVPISIRPGTLADIPFMDALQKLHARQVGWMPTATFEGKIRLGHVLVAEEVRSRQYAVSSEEAAVASLPSARCLPPTPVGYLIGNDQYFKRDDVGIIYQLNVAPGHQRGFIGAALLKAQFERSAWGCRLYSCWCAQEIAANRFWEAMGFVPLAFRTGSRTKGAGRTPRVHIFWQRRIRAGDADTPWWYPSQTAGGSLREDRLVLPIPPGTHWSEAKPIVLPKAGGDIDPGDNGPRRLPGRPRAAVKAPPINPRLISAGGLRFAAPEAGDAAGKPGSAERGDRPKRAKAKHDPRLIAAARELRDRWLEQVNATPLIGHAKYDVSRSLAGARSAMDLPGDLPRGASGDAMELRAALEPRALPPLAA